MIQKVEMTHEEKYAMYDELSKDQIIRMLIECNRVLEMYTERPAVMNEYPIGGESFMKEVDDAFRLSLSQTPSAK